MGQQPAVQPAQLARCQVAQDRAAFQPALSVVRPEAAPKLITPFAVKRDIIAGLGVEELVVIPFDDDFALLVLAYITRSPRYLATWPP